MPEVQFESASTQFTPEPELIVDDTPQELFLPTTLVGTIFFEKGYEREAYRSERCGKIRYWRCPDGHVERGKERYCEFRRACSDCSERLARECLDLWRPTLKDLTAKHQGENFTRFDMWWKIERTPAAIRDTLKRVTKQLKEYFDGNAPIHWVLPAGFEGEYLRVRVIALVDVGGRQKYSCSHLIVEYGSIPMEHLAQQFEDFLLKPLKLEEYESVEQEILFKGIHGLRTTGVIQIQNISVLEPTHKTEMSPDEKPEKPDRAKCKVCGKRFVEVSTNWHFNGYLGEVKWRPIHRAAG